MKIVIDIHERVYKGICSDAEIMIYNGMRSGKTLFASLLRAIRKGTPLPKNHGRLIDADVLAEGFEDNYEFCEALNATPTIIEAERCEGCNVAGQCIMYEPTMKACAERTDNDDKRRSNRDIEN